MGRLISWVIEETDLAVRRRTGEREREREMRWGGGVWTYLSWDCLEQSGVLLREIN